MPAVKSVTAMIDRAREENGSSASTVNVDMQAEAAPSVVHVSVSSAEETNAGSQICDGVRIKTTQKL